jgi:hypothetical protein
LRQFHGDFLRTNSAGKLTLQCKVTHCVQHVKQADLDFRTRPRQLPTFRKTGLLSPMDRGFIGYGHSASFIEVRRGCGVAYVYCQLLSSRDQRARDGGLVDAPAKRFYTATWKPAGNGSCAPFSPIGRTS